MFLYPGNSRRIEWRAVRYLKPSARVLIPLSVIWEHLGRIKTDVALDCCLPEEVEIDGLEG